MTIVIEDNKTGLTFAFDTQEEKEAFFELWDRYEVINPNE